MKVQKQAESPSEFVFTIENWTEDWASPDGFKYKYSTGFTGIFRTVWSCKKDGDNFEIHVTMINGSFMIFYFTKPQLSIRHIENGTITYL